MKIANFVNLKPVIIKIAARQALGINANKLGKSNTLIKSNEAWIIVDNLDLAPELIFAELRTITEVTGKAPKKPQVILPIPWASNSLLVLDSFLSGSNLSTASIPNSVSKLATIAKVKTIIQNVLVFAELKSGKNKLAFKSAKEEIIGKLTRWMLSIASKELDLKAMVSRIPKTTAKSGPGKFDECFRIRC